MNKGERIRLIQQCRDVLLKMPDEDEDLVLNTFDVGARTHAAGAPSLTSWLSDRASDADLIALGQHLEVLQNDPVTMPEEDAEPEELFIFASHLAVQRKFVGEVEEHLQTFRIRMFVAHDSIAMDAPWAKEIVDALNECHAGVAFLHVGFHESFYCQQECGWMLGRGIAIGRLMMGESPKALLGELQGKELGGQPAQAVGDAVLDWAMDKPALARHLGASLSMAFKHSSSYKRTDDIWKRLRLLTTVTPEQLRRIIFAAEYNSQVYGTGIGGYGGTPYRSAIASKASAWDTDGKLADRIAQLRDPDSPVVIAPPDDEVRAYVSGH